MNAFTFFVYANQNQPVELKSNNCKKYFEFSITRVTTLQTSRNRAFPFYLKAFQMFFSRVLVSNVLLSYAQYGLVLDWLKNLQFRISTQTVLTTLKYESFGFLTFCDELLLQKLSVNILHFNLLFHRTLKQFKACILSYSKISFTFLCCMTQALIPRKSPCPVSTNKPLENERLDDSGRTGQAFELEAKGC